MKKQKAAPVVSPEWKAFLEKETQRIRQFGFDERHFAEIIRATNAFNSRLWPSITEVACRLFESGSNWERSSIAILAKLIIDEESFNVAAEALRKVMPAEWDYEPFLRWPTKANQGGNSINWLRKEIITAFQDYDQDNKSADRVLAVALSDVLCLALLERERELAEFGYLPDYFLE